MKVFAKTDVGKLRDMNQDCYYISNTNEQLNLYIIADGMGGYTGGEIASNLAVNSVKSYIQNNFSSINHEKENIKKLIKDSISYANKIIYNEAKDVQELQEMGTTLDICLIYNNKVYIGHVGDSRVYRIRKGIIRKLTTDHSYVEKLVTDGTITKEEAFNHPKKNMLIKAVGCDEEIEADIIVKGFIPKDIILMCTDGLTNMLRDDEIYKILTIDIENANQNLIKNANEKGGYDNITAIIIQND